MQRVIGSSPMGSTIMCGERKIYMCHFYTVRAIYDDYHSYIAQYFFEDKIKAIEFANSEAKNNPKDLKEYIVVSLLNGIVYIVQCMGQN